MQKQLILLEKHVQWLALGLGGLILLWMIFSYVVKDPVTTSVGGKPLGPGEVDPATVEGPLNDLKRDIAKTDIPEIRITDYVESFVAAIQGSSEPLALLSGNQINSHRIQQQTGTGAVVDAGISEKSTKPVEALPKIPLARAGATNTGRSTVTYQDPAWEPKRANEPPKMIEADRDWWSGSFTISAESLAKSFAAVIDEKKINDAGLDPAAFMQTAILDVELIRQELLPGGKVGKDGLIPPLQNNALRPPFPGKNATEFEKATYLDWASQNPLEVISPVFYEVLSGDLWTQPSEENEQLAALSREERRAQKKLEADQQKQQAQARRQQGARAPRGRAGALADDLEGMGEEEFFGRQQIPQRPGIAPRRPAVGRPGRPGVVAPVNPGLPIGPGTFDVNAVADIKIIAHDDTVEAGKTYRYKIRYRILNPVYKSTAAKPELTQSLDIKSGDSGWTKAVTIRAKVEFFLAKVAGEKAEFSVFQWREGLMRRDTINATPGDMIGTTGTSVVDVRGSGRKAYILVMDALGHVSRREADADLNSNRYQDLMDEVDAATPQVGLSR